MIIVDEHTPGTGFLGGCLNCGKPIGEAHYDNCEFVTGEDKLIHGGMLGATLAQVRAQRDRRETGDEKGAV